MNEDRYPKSFKEIHKYLVNNGGRDCFAKYQGKVWMLTRQGNWRYICRCLGDITLENYLKLSLEP